jgi:signal transduction histidine kinase
MYDNGIGVSPEHFERVYKLDATTDDTGMALAILKRIVEFHGGRIWVESDAGRGSTFFITPPTGP